MLNLNLRINFVKQLRIKISEKSLTQSFDVAMTSLVQHKITSLLSDKYEITSNTTLPYYQVTKYKITSLLRDKYNITSNNR